MNEEHFTFHLQYKHSGMFANHKYEELSCPKRAENVRPHSSNSLKMRPHYSQSSRENATHPAAHPHSGAPNGNFRENICSEDDLRSRIFGAFVVKFLACLPPLGFSNIYKMV